MCTGTRAAVVSEREAGSRLVAAEDHVDVVDVVVEAEDGPDGMERAN